jgi:hypothetical protein
MAQCAFCKKSEANPQIEYEGEAICTPCMTKLLIGTPVPVEELSPPDWPHVKDDAEGITFTVHPVLLPPVIAALEHLRLGYTVDMENSSLFINFHREAWDGDGSRVGTEHYKLTIPFVHRATIGCAIGVPLDGNKGTMSQVLIFDCADVELTNHPDEPVVDLARAKEYLADDGDWQRIVDSHADGDMSEQEICQLAIDKGCGEGDYYAPDQDFIWQQGDACLRDIYAEACKYPLVFDSANRTWTCDDEAILDLNKTKDRG